VQKRKHVRGKSRIELSMWRKVRAIFGREPNSREARSLPILGSRQSSVEGANEHAPAFCAMGKHRSEERNGNSVPRPPRRSEYCRSDAMACFRHPSRQSGSPHAKWLFPDKSANLPTRQLATWRSCPGRPSLPRSAARQLESRLQAGKAQHRLKPELQPKTSLRA
jgi:hypothetical protein